MPSNGATTVVCGSTTVNEPVDAVLGTLFESLKPAGAKETSIFPSGNVPVR